MLQRFKKKRVEVVVEAPALSRLLTALAKAEASGWSVLPVNGGFGRSGPWEAKGMVGPASSMAMVLLVTDEDNLDAILEAVSGILARHIGIVTVSECEVLRPERFPSPDA
ncbi:MAG: transcriptional regulator [Myxococcota bacterium]